MSEPESSERPDGPAPSERPLLTPSILLGIGLGGLLDGIVFHQILQWHHVLSADGCCPVSTIAGLEDNMRADGVFLLVFLVVTAAGAMAALSAWREGRPAPPRRAQAGALLVGWGIFGLIDSASHFILEIHHIRDDLGGPAGWDLGFLFFALALICAGGAMIQSAASAADAEGAGASEPEAES
jgi:uncharacterized membrane protein